MKLTWCECFCVAQHNCDWRLLYYSCNEYLEEYDLGLQLETIILFW